MLNRVVLPPPLILLTAIPVPLVQFNGDIPDDRFPVKDLDYPSTFHYCHVFLPSLCRLPSSGSGPCLKIRSRHRHWRNIHWKSLYFPLNQRLRQPIPGQPVIICVQRSGKCIPLLAHLPDTYQPGKSGLLYKFQVQLRRRLAGCPPPPAGLATSIYPRLTASINAFAGIRISFFRNRISNDDRGVKIKYGTVRLQMQIIGSSPSWLVYSASAATCLLPFAPLFIGR